MSCDLAELAQIVDEFAKEREWDKLHNPRNLASSIAIEAGELLEVFQWLDNDQADKVQHNAQLRREVEDEMSDILTFLLSLATRMKIDLGDALRNKMVKNRLKYPVNEYRGRANRPIP